MYAKCIKCGSENTHRSRIRSGERTGSNFFLKPVRCRDCKERFWVRDRSAYFSVGALLAFSALVMTAGWLIIEHNMEEPFPLEASGNPTSQPSAPDVSTSGKLASAGENRTSAKGASSSASSTAQSLSPLSTTQRKTTDDHQFTVQLYQDSAENGEADAQYKLGLLYLTGNGALQDFAEAAKWLRRAAEQGYALAQYELGLIYRTGYGLAIDHVQSYVWLNLAAAAGIQEAASARDEVMRSLSNKQLAQAQKTAREWLASRVKPKTSGNGAARREPEEASL